MSQLSESEIFKNYPKTSKFWIFGCSRRLSSEELLSLKDAISQFFKTWERHGKSIDASLEILYDQFIVISSKEDPVEATGCSQDALLHFMENPLALENLKYSAPNAIFYEDDKGAIQTMPRNTFVKCLQRGQIFNEESVVFDTSLYSLDGFIQNNFRLSLKNSWHGKLYQAHKRA